MATVDETVRENILCFPSLFTNRSEVLYHILCDIGSGFYWNDKGEIETSFPEELIPWSRANAETELNRQLKDNPVFLEFFIAAKKPYFDEHQKTVDEVDTRMFIFEPMKHTYPQTKYCLLVDIPKNVTDDWREACKETKKAAVANGWRF